MVAVRANELVQKFENQAKQRQKRKPANSVSDTRRTQKSSKRSLDSLGEVFNVSGKSIERARKILKEGANDLVKAVDAGKVTVTRGAKIASLPKPKQKKEIDDPGSQIKKARLKGRSEPIVKRHDGLVGIGMGYANRAIEQLAKIPKGDALRFRAYQYVTDWIKNHQ